MTTFALQCVDIAKGYGVGDARIDILNGINLQVHANEFLAILGFSGTGKSTLIRLLAGLDFPDSGEVLYRGNRVTAPGPERGLVFQSYALMPWLSVAGNIALAVASVHSTRHKREQATLTKRYINMVGLTHAANRKPHELSGGMRQRVALARTLAMDPDVLLLDEPLSALDALTRANLQSELEHICQENGKTVVLITNDVDEALLLADRIIVLNPNGTFAEPTPVAIAKPRQRSAMNTNETFIALRAAITNYLLESSMTKKAEEVRVLPNVTPRHSLPVAYAKASASDGYAYAKHQASRYLQFSQIDKVYPTPAGPLKVVDNFELSVHKGECISVIGHSGCGKSTVLTMAAGLNSISKGSVILDQRHVLDANPERAVVFQSPSLLPWLTARQNVALGADVVYPQASQQERDDVVAYYLERVGLADSMDTKATDLSNGMKQRVGIARALRFHPSCCCWMSHLACLTASRAGSCRKC